MSQKLKELLRRSREGVAFDAASSTHISDVVVQKGLVSSGGVSHVYSPTDQPGGLGDRNVANESSKAAEVAADEAHATTKSTPPSSTAQEHQAALTKHTFAHGAHQKASADQTALGNKNKAKYHQNQMARHAEMIQHHRDMAAESVS